MKLPKVRIYPLRWIGMFLSCFMCCLCLGCSPTVNFKYIAPTVVPPKFVAETIPPPNSQGTFYQMVCAGINEEVIWEPENGDYTFTEYLVSHFQLTLDDKSISIGKPIVMTMGPQKQHGLGYTV